MDLVVRGGLGGASNILRPYLENGREARLEDVVDLESSLYGESGLLVIPDVIGMVVTGDYHSGRSDLGGGSFDLCWEWVMISPDLEMVSKALVLFAEVI